MPTARASASFDAPIAAAWEVLTDLAAYSTWNPFIVRVDAPTTALAVGSEITLHVKWPDGSGGASSRERVSIFEPPSAQPDGSLRARFMYVYIDTLDRLHLLRATRVHALTQAPGGATVYETQEDFSGLMARVVPLRKVQAGFDVQTSAMKARVEATRQASAATR